MTATPISTHTGELSAYADLDTSVAGWSCRRGAPGQYVLIGRQAAGRSRRRVRAAAPKVARLSWVCTLIEGIEQLQAPGREVTGEFTVRKPCGSCPLAYPWAHETHLRRPRSWPPVQRRSICKPAGATTVIECRRGCANAKPDDHRKPPSAWAWRNASVARPGRNAVVLRGHGVTGLPRAGYRTWAVEVLAFMREE